MPKISWVSGAESTNVAAAILSHMSKSSKKSSSKTSGGNTDTRTGFSALPIAVFVLGAGVLVWLISSSFRPSEEPAGAPSAATKDQASSDLASTAAEPSGDAASTEVEPEPLSDADRQKLLGFWERTDNPPYSIEIRLVRPNGLTDARYFNPRPINVAESLIAGKDGRLAFFMKMSDQNYEGSTYTLVYDEAQDMLVGEYFQATMGQTFEVAFQRAQR